MTAKRLSTGIERLDEALGGGLIPGTLTIVAGATGVGKTQLGMHFFTADLGEGGAGGAIIDLSSRGDSQNHDGYTQRMFAQQLTTASIENNDPQRLFQSERPEDVLPFLGYGGKRVLRSQLDTDQWHAWQSEMNRRMPQLFRFVYRHLVHGTTRFIIDGIEPQESSSDSLQIDLLELVYHRMLRQEHDWLAREVLRERFRENEAGVMQNAYDHSQSAAMVLVTTKQTMLEKLMTDPLADGDLAAGANTVLFLGRVLSEKRMQRALYIAKHRGSFADQHVIPFEITDSGLSI